MKKYIGTKTVQATPAVRKGGKVYLPDEQIPKSLETVEKGYKVIYPDGYESWCPKEEFEKTYHLAETAVERMHLEYTALAEKTGKLYAFIRSEKFNECNTDMKALLLAQDVAMADYMNLLATRTTLMETGQGSMGTFSFSVAITLLEKGFVLRREGWNGKGLMVFKQVPTDIGAEIIPNMQSVPSEAKRLILDSAKHIDYTSQCLIYNRQTGRADSWVASISDIFAKDWELVTE